MSTSWSQPETEIHAHAPGELVQTTLSRSPRVDQLTAHVRDAHCCEPLARCEDCQAERDEVRAARRDALIHSVSAARPRRVR